MRCSFHSIRWAVIAGIVFLSMFGRSGYAQDAKTNPDWSFQITPYVWLVGIGGDVTTPGGRSASFDQSIGDVLSSLNGALMLVGEVRYQRWYLLADFDYAHLSTDHSASIPILGQPSLTTTQYMGTLDAGYRFIDSNALKLDGFVGVRVMSISNTLSFSNIAQSASGGDTWADPLAAVRAILPIGSGFFANAYGDVGGGPDGDLSWQIYGGLGYNFNPNIAAFAGYRYLSTNHDVNNFNFDMSQQGPIIGATFRF